MRAPRAWGLAGLACLVATIGASAWLWTPWRYFPASEVARPAMPMQGLRLQYPPGREGVDYYGTLRLDVYIDERGHVDRIEVLESTVPESFRAAAMERFRVTPFEAARRYGLPVKSVKRVEISFAPPVNQLDSGPSSTR